EGNLIATNGLDSIQLSSGANKNEIVGNIIGGFHNFDGRIFLGNGRHGVAILDSANNVVGRRTVDLWNNILGNRSNGVFIGRGFEITAVPAVVLRRAGWINVSLTDAELAGRNLRLFQGAALDPSGGPVEPLITRVVDVQRGVMQVLVQHLSSFVLYHQQFPGPVLLAPSDGVTLNVAGSTLLWDPPPDARQYQLQVVPFAGDGPGIDVIRDLEASFVVPVPDFGEAEPNYLMLPDMGYAWRVRTTTATKAPRDLAETDWGGWSIATFRTPPVAAGSIVRVAPGDNAIVDSLTPTLAWANLNKAVFYYEVQVSTDPTFGAAAFLYWELRHGGVTTPPNSYSIPPAFPLQPGRQYHWRVRPRVQGDGSETGWSQVFTFGTP
ncbi:MAG: right-handed parallel beta-helix repeat-containing protein, partial [Chloroflexota bacterium]